MATREKRINFLLNDKEYSCIQEASRREDRPVGSWIRTKLIRELKAVGLSPEEMEGAKSG
tara:strand:- start:4172 stop:4351 length:180 start_codon:yes stop_codon:yes gene_type:complete